MIVMQRNGFCKMRTWEFRLVGKGVSCVLDCERIMPADPSAPVHERLVNYC